MNTSTESFSYGFELVRSTSASFTFTRTYSLPSDHRVLAVAVASGVPLVTLSSATSTASSHAASDASASIFGASASAGTFTASV